MDNITIFRDSMDYTKETLFSHPKRWVALTISTLLFPFILGYLVRVLHGDDPPPREGDWVHLFVDGIKLLVITCIYGAVLIGIARVYAILVSLLTTGSWSITETLSDPPVQLIPNIVALLIISGVYLIGASRFSRTGKMSDAFALHQIVRKIRRIGLRSYCLGIGILFAITFLVSEMEFGFFIFASIFRLFAELPSIPEYPPLLVVPGLLIAAFFLLLGILPLFRRWRFGLVYWLILSGAVYIILGVLPFTLGLQVGLFAQVFLTAISFVPLMLIVLSIPPWLIFSARYAVRMYDSVPEAP